jgi:membrane protein implicated in regulation of membrane protease activity
VSPRKIGAEAVGQTIEIKADLRPRASDRAEFRGTTWKILNVDQVVLPAGSVVRIDRVDGLTLHVRAVG